MAMSDQNQDVLAALPPVPHTLEIAGETLELTPLKIGELPAFVRAIRPFATYIGVEVDWLALFGERGEDVVVALALAARRPREWVAQLSLDAAIQLAEAVFEVNADFFIRQVTPALLRLAGRIGKLGDSAGPILSSASSTTATATPTS
jgi:hypothetical protein